MTTFEKLDEIVNQILLGEEVKDIDYKSYSLIIDEWESTRSTWLYVLGTDYIRIDRVLTSLLKSLKRNDVLNQIGI